MLEPGQDNALIASKDHTLITAVCESKAWDKTLDTGKADRKLNPHHQLQDYLSTLRAQNDKLVPRLFGITDSELAHLLRSFKVMANKRAEYFKLLN
ncbi:MAG: hypothetical protein WCG50_08845 [Rhodoferax sp.]|uniref:hypothetical protein n=1 Tax=Rhodoferax sp. TaxID=50421 RepID=UPI00301747B2